MFAHLPVAMATMHSGVENSENGRRKLCKRTLTCELISFGSLFSMSGPLSSDILKLLPIQVERTLSSCCLVFFSKSCSLLVWRFCLECCGAKGPPIYSAVGVAVGLCSFVVPLTLATTSNTPSLSLSLSLSLAACMGGNASSLTWPPCKTRHRLSTEWGCMQQWQQHRLTGNSEDDRTRQHALPAVSHSACVTQ